MMRVTSAPVSVRFAKTSAAAQAQMKLYQQQLDSYLLGLSQPAETSCCSTPQAEEKKDDYASPFASWLTSKNLPKRMIGNVLDWACWFFESIVRDIKRLLSPAH